MIWLLRHGRTEANARGLLLGRADPALDDVGREQALRAARALVGVDATRVVSSPLRRCRETAALVGETLGLPVVVDDRWVEMDYGELDGTPVASVPPETWAAWMADVGWTPPGGESIAVLGERVRSACDELLASSPDDSAVVVSHVSPIKAAVAWGLGVGDEVAWRLFLAPASISCLSTARGRPALHAYNDVSHLTRP